MRGTLHFVAAEDLRWLLSLLAPRVLSRVARRYRELELDDAAFTKSRRCLTRALAGGNRLSRPEAYQVLEAGGVSTQGQRGIHVLQRLALDQLLCFGPREGKQHTFVLLDEWVPRSKKRTREHALGELARRYFTGHGPATLADFTWWTGLTVAEAREALELAEAELHESEVGTTAYWSGRAPKRRAAAGVQLLPGFDEFLLGYEDRGAVLDEAHRDRVHPGANGLLCPTVVIDGRVAGTWKRTLAKRGVSIAVRPFGRLEQVSRQHLQAEAERYARFLGQTLHCLEVEGPSARRPRES